MTLRALTAWLGLVTGACDFSTLTCPGGTSDSGLGTCLSDSSLSEELGIAEPLGTALPSFYYLGNSAGFVLGNGTFFSRTSSPSNSFFIPDVDASFGRGPLLSAGTITEAFTSVAVYSASQAANAYANGYWTWDPLTGVSSDLTGYIVAAGYALTSDGTVAGLVARYTPRGALDTTFGGTGYVLARSTAFTSGSFAVFKSVAIDSQGNVVVGGYGNSQPTFSGYLGYLETLTDGDPILLQQTGESLQSVLVRYLPDGSLDESGFDTSALSSPASGSAVDGFATSPSTGFIGSATAGTRYDVIHGIAIDADDGIFAVGGTAVSANPGPALERPFIAHYSSQGELLTRQTGRTSPALNTFAVGATHEYYTAVAVDASGNAVVAGNSGAITVGAGPTATYNTVPLIARFALTASGTSTESLALDTAFNAPDGYLVTAAAPIGASNTVRSMAIDADSDAYVLSGDALLAGDNMTLVMTVGASAPHTVASSTGPAIGYGAPGSAADSFHGVAVISSGGTTRYLGVGFAESAGPAATRSLIASHVPGTLALDTAGFEASPYAEAPATLVVPGAFFPSFGINWLPAAITMFNSTAGLQLGPNASAYGGGTLEKLNAIAPSADGTHAVVVGYSTDSSSAPSTGRSFPILLIYKIDGTFVNPGEYDDFYTLQGAL
jgi:hypothetical protein